MITVKIPYRVSLFGGGCDYPEYYHGRGADIISFAIDKYMYASIASRFEGGYRVSYTQTETVERIEDIEHDLIRGVLQEFDAPNGLEIVTIGELPGGTGLGSSAAVTVGMVAAIRTWKNSPSSPIDTDVVAWEIERKAGYSPGLQDHIRCWAGGKGVISFMPNGRISRHQFTASLPLDNFILVYTHQKRSSEAILNQHMTDPNIDYLNEIQLITRWAINAISSGNIHHLGPLLDTAWGVKKQLVTGISNSEIDDLYDLGKSLGATGGKICGAGGGGFMLFYHPGDKLSRKLFVDRMELEGYKHLPFELGHREVKVI